MSLFILSPALTVSGTIDLLNRVDGTPDGGGRTPVEVVDFKTTSTVEAHMDEQARNDDRARCIRDVTPQLVLYAIAAEESLGYDPREAGVHLLNARSPQERISVDITEEAKESLRAQIAEIITRIKSGTFPLNPTG